MTKLSPRITTSLDFGIFPGWCSFSCGFTYGELVKTLKSDGWADAIKYDRKLIEESEWLACSREHGGRTYYYIILRDRFDFSDLSYCKLAHEILHIVAFHLPNILDRNREFEAEAYLHTHLMKQCLSALRTKNKK